ncbi:unnamed protein product [Parnassius apollo]|uniref:(apollo) hypothetical protein n=1 Tax=Parnassius apollo TaxID=110799 RepID=A0A8S3WMU5_PARAO|nr:unnamed protein product [Parnassius apollo]
MQRSAEVLTIPTITPQELETKNDPKTKKISCGSTPTTCKKDPYRSFDGICNNLKNPSWGAVKEPFSELVNNSYADGVHQFPVTSENEQLPNPRAISLLLFPSKNIIDYKWNLNTMQWGQIIAHDMSFAGRITLINNNPVTCCDSEGQLASDSDKNPFCAPILIPENDAVNKEDGRECMKFVRTVSTKDIDCTSSKSPSFPINEVTSYLDLSLTYGEDNMAKNKLIYPNAKGYVNDYNPNVKAGVLKESASAAFRYFHTLIRGQLRLFKESRFPYQSIRLSDWLNKPSILEKNDGYDGLMIGLSFQPQDKSDQYFDREITQYLFKGNKTLGLDLRAIDIQRARDHGVANYIDLRSYCGLSIPKDFDDLCDYMSIKNVNALKSIYKRVEDIELTVGGSLEKHVHGTLVGPTFLCILLRQFYITRVGDRYFYENGEDKEIAFTLDQLETIRKGSSMARLFCDNGINIKKMQAKAFELVSPWNAIVQCDQLPFVNLTLWKDTQ